MIHDQYSMQYFSRMIPGARVTGASLDLLDMMKKVELIL